MYKVKEVALLAGISVRTLHHYDHIGLLSPESVTESGYRLYSDKNLETLQYILFLRELDFPLKEIGEILSSQQFDRDEALVSQKRILIKKRERLDRIIKTIDQTITSRNGGHIMNKNEMFEAFDMKEIEEHQKRYAAEVKEKFGSTDAYTESSSKTKGYNREDWIVIKSEADSIMKSLAGKMDKDPGDYETQKLIGLWRKHISDRYYNCTKEILADLGESYVDDKRFSENIEKYRTGLSVFFREAIRIYCG